MKPDDAMDTMKENTCGYKCQHLSQRRWQLLPTLTKNDNVVKYFYQNYKTIHSIGDS